MTGFQDEIDAMIRDNADAAQLATWCTVLKSELGHKRKECRELSETLQQMKRSLETTRSTLSERNAELSAANSRVTDLESDIAEQVRKSSVVAD
jgi:chromosome segregation ATPase